MIASSVELVFSIVAVGTIGWLSFKANLIDRTGFLAATFVGSSILFFGGLKWFLVLLSFHLTAGLFTKYRYDMKLKIKVAEAKGGARAWQNVLSNGVMASVLAIYYGLTSGKVFAAGYLGAISTSLADTLATEIGLLNLSEPRLITNPRVKVEAGTSGGLTLLGEIACLSGSALIALVVFIVDFEGLTISQILVFNLLVGFLGCNFDSLLGATVQATYKCQVCGTITEKKTHCEQPAKFHKGIKFIDNNVVNFLSTIVGTLTAILLYTHFPQLQR